MSLVRPAFGATSSSWRASALRVVGPAAAFGIPAALLGAFGAGIGDAHIPILPSGIAFSLLLALGWRAMPGLAAGAATAGAWCAAAGEGPIALSDASWLVMLPFGACAQAAVSYALARRISPNLFDTSSVWELTRFLLTSGPAGSAVGALIAGAASWPASGLPFMYLVMAGAAWWVFDLFTGLAVVALCVGFFSKSPRPFIPLTLVAAAGATLLGAAVIFGWITHDAVLIQVTPDLTPMQFNTALGFVLCGTGLLALVNQYTRTAMAIGGFLALLGALTLSQYLLGVNLGLDELIIEHHVTVNTTFAGRMAPNTALCFILFALCLCPSLFASHASVASSTLCSIVASLGFITLLSYAAGIHSAYGWAQMTPMALHTAVGFLTLGLGGLAREVVQTEGAARRVSLSPLPTGIALAAISIWVWQAVYHDEQEKIRRLAGDRAADTTRLVDMEITYYNHALNRMAARWEAQGGTTDAAWTSDVQGHLRDFPTIAAIARADAESRVRWLEPLEGNEEILGFQLSSHPHGREVLQRVRETGMLASTDVISLNKIGRGFIVFAPLYSAGKLDGYAAVLYRIDNLFEILASAGMEDYQFRVLEKDVTIFASDAETPWPGNSEMLIEREMRGGAWRLQMVPRTPWLASQRSNLPLLILFAGLFLSAATTVSLYLLEAVRGQYDVIQMSENRLRQLIDSAPTGLITTDRNGRICEINPEAQRQFGYRAEELIGQPVEMLVPTSLRMSHFQDRQAYTRCPVTRAMGAGRDLSAVRKDGRVFPVEVALAPFQTREGVQILALVTDITERDEARRKLEAHTRALELINKDLDDFAYVASHDLRAPLTAISSLVSWMEEDAAEVLPEKSVHHLHLVKNRVARMGRLLEDLLDYSRAGRTTNHVETVDTEDMVAQVADLVRGRFSLTLTTSGLPVFDTVRTPLQQVLRNLVSNAIKHHDREHGRIEVSARENGQFYVFRVVDDGPGIPAQYHSKVFNMFQTLRPRDEVEGSGMGLALVRKLVERYGGNVYLLESTGRGTSIEFTWPRAVSGD